MVRIYFAPHRAQGFDKLIPCWFKTEQPASYIDAVKEKTDKAPTARSVTLMHNMVLNNDLSGAFGRLSKPIVFAYQEMLQSDADHLKVALDDKIRLELFADEGHALLQRRADQIQCDYYKFHRAERRLKASVGQDSSWRAGADEQGWRTVSLLPLIPRHNAHGCHALGSLSAVASEV